MRKFLFTVVVPMFNVESYLPATLRSLDWQTFPFERIQVVIVDDGSSDRSAAIAKEWAAGKPNTTVIVQANAGPGAARNRALEIAEGEWFTSVDGDDIIDKKYFAEVANILQRDSAHVTSAVSTRLWMLNDQTGRWSDTHVLGNKFRHGDRLARLQDDPDAFSLSSTTFLRIDILNQNNLRYDPLLRPNFEDAHLVGRYLAYFPDPVMAIASKARYYYRRPQAGTTLVQTAWTKRDHYTTVPRLGHLVMLASIHERLGSVPVWAQYMVLYDVMWYVQQEQAMNSKSAWLDAETASEFVGLLEEIMKYIDASTIEKFPYQQLTWVMRQALLVRFKDNGITPRVFRLGKRGTKAQVIYLYRGQCPQLRALSGSRQSPVEVLGGRSHLYFGEEWTVELSLTWETGDPEVTSDCLWVDGIPAFSRDIQRVRRYSPPKSSFRLESSTDRTKSKVISLLSRARRRLVIASLATGRPRLRILNEVLKEFIDKKRKSREVAERKQWVASIKERAASAEVCSTYVEAWVVMDRPDTADDNGEHLYRYLMTNRPDINAYFFLAKTSPHWARLAAEGFRLIEYGSDEAAVITLNSVVRASSDAVEPCMYPIPRKDFGESPGIFVFLQHGVTINDLSRWLNGKKIGLMVTATMPEYLSIVGAESNYMLNKTRVEMLGFARWDRLSVLRQEQQERETILIAPTWRQSLAENLTQLPEQHERYDVFEQSEYGKAWLGILRSSELAATGKKVRLVLHPRLNALLPQLDLPNHVTQLGGSSLSYQDELSHASLMVTDFSSVAIDAAFVGVPVLYYQFDAETFFSSQNYRAGYFSFKRDGFGPVTHEEEEALEAIREAGERGFKVEEPYLSRARDTFPFRDANNCKRIVEAIEARIENT